VSVVVVFAAQVCFYDSHPQSLVAFAHKFLFILTDSNFTGSLENSIRGDQTSSASDGREKVHGVSFETASPLCSG